MIRLAMSLLRDLDFPPSTTPFSGSGQLTPPNRDTYSRYIVHACVYKMQNGAAIAIINLKLSHKSDFNGILCGVFLAE